MNYYSDITLLPNTEVNLGFLWQKIFQQVHIALVDSKTGVNESAIALSITRYGDQQFPLGNQLRLIAGREDDLIALNVQQWLTRFIDYCHITSIKRVPQNIKQYAVFKRKSVKSIEKKARQTAAYLNKPYVEILAHMKKQGNSNPCKLPFIQVESQSTKKNTGPTVSPYFLLFIERTFYEVPSTGTFDCYGLSKNASVPWFN